MTNFNLFTNSIIADGPERIKKAEAYQQRVEAIKQEINQAYLPLLRNEKNIFKKLILTIKKKHEIRRAINTLTSSDKLYVSVSY